MTEVEWLASDNPVAMLEHVRPMATEKRMQQCIDLCRESASSTYTGKNSGPCIIRDVFGNPWRPIVQQVPLEKPTEWDHQTEKYRPIAQQTEKYRTVTPTSKEVVESIGLEACTLWNPDWLTLDVQAILNGIARECQSCQGFGSHLKPLGNGRWEDCPTCSGASKIYDFTDMPILADALEDAGCQNEEILNHCRNKERCPTCYGNEMFYNTPGKLRDRPCDDCGGNDWRPMRGSHTRGCWVLRLLGGE